MKKRKKNGYIVKELTATLAILLILVLILANTVFSLVKNSGYGMRNTLDNGDIVYVSRLEKYKRFSLVSLIIPGTNESSIRRVVGLPGESVYYSLDELYVEDRIIFEPFLEKKLAQYKMNDEIYTENFDSKDMLKATNGRIPKGKYLVLGDNRPFTTDSRYYGLVDESKIIGVVKLRIWPLHKIRSY